MCAIKRVIFYWVVSLALDPASSLEQLPPVAENDIVRAEGAIRSVTNGLFAGLRFIALNNKEKLKDYSLIHNYFVSLTLQDYMSLNEISRLSRVDKTTIGNESYNMVLLLNQVLNSDGDSPENSDKEISSGVFANDVFDRYLQSLAYLDKIGLTDTPLGINKDIVSILGKRVQQYNFSESDDELLQSNEFWQPVRSGRRIYNGKNTKAKYYPFMAAVLIFSQFQCGGSIIKDDLIITAASCLQLAWNNRFYRENPAFLSVRIGSTFYNSGGEEIPVMEVYFHPSYSPKNLNHNIGLIRLIRRINFQKKKKAVRKISMDINDSPVLPSNTPGVIILGWGAKTRTLVRNPWRDRLSYDILDVYSFEDCQEIYSKEYVKRENFCAGYISKGSGACNRDVGGPGVVGGYLVGVVSFGSPVCGTPDAPTVFTKVGYYMDWIEQIMEQDVPHERLKTTTMPPHRGFQYTAYMKTDFYLDPVMPGPTTESSIVIEPIQPDFETETEITPEADREVSVITESPDLLRTASDDETTVEYTGKDAENILNDFIKAMFGLSEDEKESEQISDEKEFMVTTTAAPPVTPQTRARTGPPVDWWGQAPKFQNYQPGPMFRDVRDKPPQLPFSQRYQRVTSYVQSWTSQTLPPKYPPTLLQRVTAKLQTVMYNVEPPITHRSLLPPTALPYYDAKDKDDLEEDLMKIIDNTNLRATDNSTLVSNPETIDKSIINLLYDIDNETEKDDFKSLFDEVRKQVLDLTEKSVSSTLRDLVENTNDKHDTLSTPTTTITTTTTTTTTRATTATAKPVTSPEPVVLFERAIEAREEEGIVLINNEGGYNNTGIQNAVDKPDNETKTTSGQQPAASVAESIPTINTSTERVNETEIVSKNLLDEILSAIFSDKNTTES